MTQEPARLRTPLGEEVLKLKAGDHVDLRAETNVLVVLNTCQHPLDSNPNYAPKPVKLTVLQMPPPFP